MSNTIDSKSSQAIQKTIEAGMPVGLPIDDWKSSQVPPKTVMRGQYCHVEPYVVELHCSELYQSLSLNTDFRNWTYLPYGPFSDEDGFRQWSQSACAGDDPLFHIVKDLQTEKIVGLASYLRISPDVGSIEVGHIHFSPLMQRTRMSTESMYLMMSRVFEELGYRRYEWKCDALNAASRNAAERYGFQFEGIFRQATMYKGRNRDTAWYSVIDSEWPQLREGFKLWLSLENFDRKGQQVRMLKDCLKLFEK